MLIIGGPLAVSDNVMGQLAAIGVYAIRIGGIDYTETSTQLASFELSLDLGFGYLNWDFDWASYVNRTAGITQPERGHKVSARVVLMAHGDWYADTMAAAAVLSVHNGRLENQQKFPLITTGTRPRSGALSVWLVRRAVRCRVCLVSRPRTVGTTSPGSACRRATTARTVHSNAFTIQPIGGPHALSDGLTAGGSSLADRLGRVPGAAGREPRLRPRLIQTSEPQGRVAPLQTRHGEGALRGPLLRSAQCLCVAHCAPRDVASAFACGKLGSYEATLPSRDRTARSRPLLCAVGGGSSWGLWSWWLAVAVVAIVLLTDGGSDGGSDDGSNAASGTDTPTTTAAPGAADAPPPTNDAEPLPTGPCRSNQLAGELVAAGLEVQTQVAVIVVTNRSETDCTLNGIPGLTIVAESGDQPTVVTAGGARSRPNSSPRR